MESGYHFAYYSRVSYLSLKKGFWNIYQTVDKELPFLFHLTSFHLYLERQRIFAPLLEVLYLHSLSNLYGFRCRFSYGCQTVMLSDEFFEGLV